MSTDTITATTSDVPSECLFFVLGGSIWQHMGVVCDLGVRKRLEPFIAAATELTPACFTPNLCPTTNKL